MDNEPTRNLISVLIYARRHTTADWKGRLESYKPPVGLDSGYKVWYDYNTLGQKIGIKIRDNASPNPNVTYDVSYDYFPNGWLKTVKSGVDTVSSYEYDVTGNRTRTILANGTYTDYAFDTADPRYMLDSVKHYKKIGSVVNPASDTVLANIGYPERDPSGSPTSMTDWTGTWDYGYDSNNRLTAAVPPNPVPDQPAGGPYGYDWVGNRLNPPTGSNPMQYNNADQLTAWPGMHTYTYDAAGNLYQVKNPAGTTVQRSYTYTDSGLLWRAYEGSSQNPMLENTWDADDNRVSFTADSATHTFVYDTTAGIPAVIQEDDIYYIREPGGELIARQTSNSLHYYHFDQLGSTRLLTNGDGDVTDKYAYDAYGAVISHEKLSGSITGGQPYQYVGKLGYYTHWQEPEFGMLQLGVRFYDATVGWFTQQDPVNSADWSTYTYAFCSPLNYVDPDGRLALSAICWAIKCAICVKGTADYATRISEHYRLIHGPKKDSGRDAPNAIKHCTWACESRKQCGHLCARAAVYSWELKPLAMGGKQGEIDSGMDMINDDVGLELGGQESECYDSCKDALKKGKLIHF